MLTFEYINLICPSSAFTVWAASCRLSILVKGLWCCSTGRTPSTSLNCKHAVTCSHCSHGTLCNGVLPRAIWSIQNRILSFQWLDCSVWGVFVASYSFVRWKLRQTYIIKTVLKRNYLINFFPSPGTGLQKGGLKGWRHDLRLAWCLTKTSLKF